MPELTKATTAIQYRMSVRPVDRVLVALVLAQRLLIVGPILRQLLKWRGTDIPAACLAPGTGLILMHGGRVVVHYKARIGRNVSLMQNCTIGRGDIWLPEADDFDGFTIGDDAIIGAGAVVLSSHGTLSVGAGSIVGANAVLTKSTGEQEIWAGQPARKVGTR